MMQPTINVLELQVDAIVRNAVTKKGPNLHELFARAKKHRTENPVVVEIPPPQVNEDEAQLVESSSDESV